MNPTSVLIADDHPLLRQGLKAVIESDPSFTVTAEASDGEAALRLIAEYQPSIVVLDINMPKRDGLSVAREMQAGHCEAKIIFITVHTGEDLFREALKLGSKGYILKDTSLVEILHGLRTVRDGQYFVPPSLMEVLVNSQRDSPHANEPSQLTPSERRILRLIAAGKSSKEIAEELLIHYKTVENHRTNISQKLGVSGPHALMRFALQHRAEL
ncbi:MAG: response regulator transcription factor [Acidobacteriaceae bacterium]|nr:response regulator transcription factor [Acidobacteriaceae bacterium]